MIIAIPIYILVMSEMNISDHLQLRKGTPLNYIKPSLPAWLTLTQMGLDIKCCESWKYRMLPPLSARKIFANPFDNVLQNINASNETKCNIESVRSNETFETREFGAIRSRKRLIAHLGCVNALAFDPSGSGLLLSGGDDRRVLLWKCPQFEDTSRVRPVALPGEHDSNIFCLDFNGPNETKVFSGGNDERVLVHDLADGGRTQDIFLHEAAVYGVDGHPTNKDIFVTACADGRVQIFDLRQNPKENVEPNLVAVASRPFRPFLGVQFHPYEPRMLVTANQKEGARLWDIRNPRKKVLVYGSTEVYAKRNGPRWYGEAANRCMAVRFNKTGSRIAALGRRMPPVVYELSSPTPLVELDAPGYYNSCTMKSVCFGGVEDDYVLAGSDDFNLYAWKIPTNDDCCNGAEQTQLINRASVVLRGHRSIVNQVRYNAPDGTIATGGVEKCVRLWSPFRVPGREQIAGRNDPEINNEHIMENEEVEPDELHEDRIISSRTNYLRLVQESHSVLTHDYSHETTEENPRMLAFFDRLAQREMEDDKFSSSSSSSDGDGPSGTYRNRPSRPTSPNSYVSQLSDLTESENDCPLLNEGLNPTSVENTHQENSNFNLEPSSNSTAIGRFIANQTDNLNSDTSGALHTNGIPNIADGSGLEDTGGTTPNDNNAEEEEEEETPRISALIAKKRMRLEYYRKRKLRYARIWPKGESPLTDAANASRTLQRSLEKAKKIVSISSTSSSSSNSSPESDSSSEESTLSTSTVDESLNADRGKDGAMVGRNHLEYNNAESSENNLSEPALNNIELSAEISNISQNMASTSNTVPDDKCDIENGLLPIHMHSPSSMARRRLVKDDAKMRASILRALKEYEQGVYTFCF